MTCEVCESRPGDLESYSDGNATWTRVHCLECSVLYRTGLKLEMPENVKVYSATELEAWKGEVLGKTDDP